jgi:hypothetical protein
VKEELARAYHIVMRSFADTGRAPHYTDIAREMGTKPEPARLLLHELTSMRLPNWLSPGTDLIASFAPFSNIPNHHRVTVDGQQRWFAQCGLEALALGHLFPGRTVEVASTCLDCGDAIGVTLRDASLVALEPPSAVAHSNVPLADWYVDVGKS